MGLLEPGVSGPTVLELQLPRCYAGLGAPAVNFPIPGIS